VSFEDRQDQLGHKSGRITTHYSQAELTSLIETADKVCATSPANLAQPHGFVAGGLVSVALKIDRDECPS
jgi:hypothetical protein